MHKFILSWNSTCFEQFVCPSSAVYSLYTQQWYMSYRFVDSFRVGPGRNWSCSKAVCQPVWHIPLLNVQWIDCWWWADELFETCRVSWQNKFVKLVHLVGFITKKFVTMRGQMNVKKTVWHFLKTVCQLCSDIHNNTKCWDAIPSLTKPKSCGKMLYGTYGDITRW